MHGGHAPVYQDLHFLGVVPVNEPPGVGTGDYPHSSLRSLVQALPVDIHEGLGSGYHVGRADGGVEFVYFKSRHEESALIRHHFQQIGIIGQIAAVLDGAGAGFDGHAQSGTANGVTHGGPAQSRRFFDKGLDFVLAELDVHGAVARAGTGPTGGGELDLVGPYPGHLPYFGPYTVGAIGHSYGNSGVDVKGVVVPGGTGPVGQAAGGGKYSHR